MTTMSSLANIQTKERKTLLLLAQIVGGSLLIALCAQIRIPLPFTPVPITLQTLAVMLVGGMLGSRNGALSVLVYLAEGMLGLPVLSGGHSSMLALLSPVGGYLVGFVFQAYITGWFVERRQQLGNIMLLGGIALSCVANLTIGSAWLGFFVGSQHAFMLGVVPFIPGEIIKIFVVYSILMRYGSRSGR